MRCVAGLLILLLAAGAAAPLAAAEKTSGEELLKYQKSKYRRMGDSYYSNGGYWGAYENYKRLAAAGEEDPLVLYRLAYSARNLRRVDEAKDSFTRAALGYQSRIESGEATLGDYYHLASIYSYLKDPARRQGAARGGIALLEESKAGKGLDGADLFRLSRLYGFLGRREDAEKAMGRAIEAYRKAKDVPADDLYFATAMIGRARDLMAAGDYKEAAGLYEEILERRPRSPGATYELGLARLRTGDLEGAVEAWGRARRSDPTRATEAGYAYHLLRRLQAYHGKYPEAGPVDVEGPFAAMDRQRMELEIAQLVGEVSEALKALKASQEGSGDLIAASQIASRPEDVHADKLQADLAAVLLAYHLRRLPIREVASNFGLLGWIFSEGAGS